MIIGLSGPSAAGKSTLIQRLIGCFGGQFLLSHTTREQRTTDYPGEYAYLDPSTFEEMQQHSEFCWHTVVRGKAYGTRIIDVDTALQSDSLSFAALTIEYGALNLRDYARQHKLLSRVSLVYLHIADEKELTRRMRARGDSDEAIATNLHLTREWNTHAAQLSVFDLVVNASRPLDDVFAKVREFIEEIM